MNSAIPYLQRQLAPLVARIHTLAAWCRDERYRDELIRLRAERFNIEQRILRARRNAHA